MRVGIGYDAHRLRVGRELILGGVHIEHPTGLEGHSDGDALTHAVIDALLGAAGLGDIGRLFPDTDPRYEGADSLDLLSAAVEILSEGGYRVVNVDSTVIAQEPRLEKHLARMAANLAKRLQVESVNVKATSPEGLGALGQQLGIAAQAVVTIESVA